MYERLKTILLSLLVVFSIAQFGLLVIRGLDPVRQIRYNEVAQQEKENHGSELLKILAAPPRMIAHVPEAPSLISSLEVKHILLRSSSRYYSNILNRVFDVLTSAPILTDQQLYEVDSSVWNPDVYALELILQQPLPIDVYFELLDVSYIGVNIPLIDRFYISATEEDTVYFSDSEGHVYQGPWKARSIIFYEALKACESVSALAIRPYDFNQHQVQTTRAIYFSSTPNNIAPWTTSYVVDANSFHEIAPQAFVDQASLRVSVYESVPFYEDLSQRLRLVGNQLVLERWPWHIGRTDQLAQPLWTETVTFLSSLGLWSREDHIIDGVQNQTGQMTIFFLQVYDGKPLFHVDGDTQLAQSGLRATSNRGSLTALTFKPLLIRNALQTSSAKSQEQALTAFLTLCQQEGIELESLVLRDIYEGFLCMPGRNAEEVWVIELMDGSRYLFNMITNEYEAQMPRIAIR